MHKLLLIQIIFQNKSLLTQVKIKLLLASVACRGALVTCNQAVAGWIRRSCTIVSLDLKQQINDTKANGPLILQLNGLAGALESSHS